MTLADLGKNIISSAPTLGAILGGPVGSAAGAVVSLIGSAFGITSTDPKEIVDRINADPDRELKLQSLEYQHAETFAKIAAGNFKSHVEDVESARERSLEVIKATGKDDMPALLTILLLAAFVMFGLSSLLPSLPKEASGLIGVMIGYLGKELKEALEYWFGSDKSDN